MTRHEVGWMDVSDCCSSRFSESGRLVRLKVFDVSLLALSLSTKGVQLECFSKVKAV